MDRYRIKPGQKVDLDDFDPDDRSAWKDSKEAALEKLAGLRLELDHLQEILYAEHTHKILVVLQAMDTAGKDGTIRSVFEGVNPQGVHVASFKGPTLVEADHDFLWRIHAQVPGKGELVMFNRSHYEEVLVVRVHNLVPEKVWRGRYKLINEFEKMLAETGTTILKFFLHITPEEQKKRLLDRIDTPEKNWKFSPEDLVERKLWPDYMKAYTDALYETSTDYAPWYVVPANHNWYRNLLVASVIVEKMKKLNMQYPPAVENITQYRSQLI